MPRPEDALTELQYETYLEKYHNISHEITAMRTKTAILLGIIGIIFTIIVTICLFIIDKCGDYDTIIGLFGCMCVVIFFNYFVIYIMTHTINLAEYPDDTILGDLDSDVTNGSNHCSRKSSLEKIIASLKYNTINLIKEYKFFKGTSDAVDIMCFVIFAMGGVALISHFLGYPIHNYVCFLILFSLLLAGCLTIPLVLSVGRFQQIRDLFMGDYKICVILGCILFTVVVWSVLLGAILG